MKYFGTDGIRNEADTFTPDFTAKIIRGLIDYAGDNIKILLAGDTRESTPWILQDLAIACDTFGIEYCHAGLLPTPAINYCFFKSGFDYAIDVTASHNPYTDNGIKIFERGSKSGQKLSEEACLAIEKVLESPVFHYRPFPITIREDLFHDSLSLYREHLLTYLGKDTDLSGLKIGLDCANGATSVLNKTLFEELGAKVSLINASSCYDQIINKDCGSTHLEPLKDLVLKEKLDLGIAFDGDGDRCLLVDSEGETVDGDEIIAILANFLKLDKIAVTVMANQGLLNWAEKNGIKTEITPVGDSNVYAAMREKNISLGGEQSGHIILPHEPTGDGMLTGLMIAKILAKTKKPLSELKKIITKSPQVIFNLPATKEQKQSLKTSDSAKKLLLNYAEKLKPLNGRLLVRPSGTEPLIRITLWGDDEPKIATLGNELKTKLGEIL